MEKQKRGFAVMDPEEVKRLAKLGGHAAHESGNAHRFTAEEARIAGKKGGEAVAAKRRQTASSDARHLPPSKD